MNDHIFFLGYPDLTEYAVGLTIKIIGVLLLFLTLFVLISFAYNVVVTLFKSQAKKVINFSKMGSVLVLAFLLSVYVPIAFSIAKVMEIMERATRPKELNSLIITIDELEKQIEAQNTEEKLSLKDKIGAQIENAGKVLKGGLVYVISAEILSDPLRRLIRMTVCFINKSLIILFFCVGPFACLFSILPGFEHKFLSWLSTYITMLFVPVIFNLLELINNEAYKFILNSNLLDLGMFSHLAYNGASIVLYLLPYWIAGKIVGNADAGRFLSMAGQMATFAAGKAGGIMGSFSQTKFGGGSGDIGNVVSTAKDAMDTK